MPLPKKAISTGIPDIDVKGTGISESASKNATETAKTQKKLKKERERLRKLPANYVGGLDPLGVLGLFLSIIPVIGLILDLMSLGNYNKLIYDDGRYVPLIGAIVGLLSTMMFLGGVYLIVSGSGVAGLLAIIGGAH